MAQKVLPEERSEHQSQQTPAVSINQDLIRDELRRIVVSRHFQASRRGQEFLRYVVNQKNDGHGDLLKERLIGVEIFGRKPDYSTGDDPVVRVQAGDVRRRLERYYADPEVHSEIIISIPLGSYSPTFLRRDEPARPALVTDQFPEINIVDAQQGTRPAIESPNPGPPELSPQADTPVPIPSPAPNHSADEVERLDTSSPGGSDDTSLPGSLARIPKRRVVLSAIVTVLMLALLGTWFYHRRFAGGVRSFWLPASKSTKAVLICLPKPMVYRPSDRLFEKYEKLHPDTVLTREARQDRFLPLDPDETIRWGDMKQVRTSGPGIGAVVAAVKISKLLTEQGIRFELRFGEEATYSEMRESPVIIIGGINSDWSTQLTSGSAFVFDQSVEAPSIRETGGAKRVWRIERNSSDTTKDFGLITRQFSERTGHFLVQVAGISHFGTEAASEILTDPQELASALRANGVQEFGKNLQIVVSTDITNDQSGPPHVIAVNSW